MTVQRIVIIGGGVAGLTAASSARQAAPAASIHLICEEPGLPYYRSRLGTALGDGDFSRLTLRSHQWFIDNDIQLVHAQATAIAAVDRRVSFSDGSYLHYDSLVLAAGAAPVLPILNQGQGPSPSPLRSREDMQRQCGLSGPVVVLGSGPWAVESAWQLSRAGQQVTLVARKPQLLSGLASRELSNFLLHLAADTDMRIAMQGQAVTWENNYLLLADGRGFPAQRVLAAAGAYPRLELAHSAGLAIGKGVLVDNTMATGDPHIWCAGDMAEYQGRIEGRWSAAMAQGRVAGLNAAYAWDTEQGREEAPAVYEPEILPLYMDALGVQIWLGGDISGESQILRRDMHNGCFRQIFVREGKLIGLAMVGRELPTMKARKALLNPISAAEAAALFA